MIIIVNTPQTSRKSTVVSELHRTEKLSIFHTHFTHQAFCNRHQHTYIDEREMVLFEISHLLSQIDLDIFI